MMAMEKSLIAFLTGVFVVLGAMVVQPLFTEAAPRGDCPPERGPGVMSERLAADLGLSRDDIDKYMRSGVNPHELGRAALLAKASGKPLAEVLTMKTLANSWRDVEQALGVTPQAVQALGREMMAARLAADVPIASGEALALLELRYSPPDIAMAALLAESAHKPVGEVLAMRKINNHWGDVAKSLEISDESFRAVMAKLAEVMPPPHHGRPWQSPGLTDRPEAGPGL